MTARGANTPWKGRRIGELGKRWLESYSPLITAMNPQAIHNMPTPTPTSRFIQSVRMMHATATSAPRIARGGVAIRHESGQQAGTSFELQRRRRRVQKTRIKRSTPVDLDRPPAPPTMRKGGTTPGTGRQCGKFLTKPRRWQRSNGNIDHGHRPRWSNVAIDKSRTR